MTLHARVTKFTKKNPLAVNGWQKANVFVGMSEGNIPIMSGLNDMTALAQFVSAWKNIQTKMLLAPATPVALHALEDDTDHFALMVFNSEAELSQMMDFLRLGDDLFLYYTSARSNLASVLGLDVKTYPSVDLGITDLSSLTIEQLRALTNPMPSMPD